jgi:hypothetical protein
MMTLRRTAARGAGAFVPALLVLFGVGGCVRSGVEIQTLPDGSRELKCRSALQKCLDSVDAVCKGSSYEVLYARDEQTIYGVQQTYVEGRSSHARVHCIGPHDPPIYDDQASAAASDTAPAPNAAPAPSGSATAASSAGTAPSAPPPACVPGTTQACIGAAACAGGQACLPDGSGYGACDCGGAAAGAPSR